jgi:hypothetical protein
MTIEMTQEELKGALTRLNLEGTLIDREGVIVATLTTSSITLDTIKQLGRVTRLHVGDSQGLILSIPRQDENLEEDELPVVQVKRRKRDGAAVVHALANLRGSESERAAMQVVAQEAKEPKEGKEATTAVTATRTTVSAALASEVAISIVALLKAVEGASEGVLTVGEASFLGEEVGEADAKLRFIVRL